MLAIFESTCDIKRRGQAVEPYGSRPSFATQATGVRCHVEMRRQRGFNSVTGQWVTRTEYTFLFPLNVDVLEGDQLTNIYKRGTLLANSAGTPLALRVDGGALEAAGAGVATKEISAVLVQ